MAPVATARSRSKAHAAERLQAADRSLADVLPLREIDEMVAVAEAAVAAAASPAGSRTSAVTGEELPAAGEVAQVRRANLLRAFAERRRLLTGALSVGEVAELLGVGRQTPHDRARAGTLLAVKENGRLVFPDWQFDPDGPDGVVAGLPEVLRVLAERPISPLGRVRWFLEPKLLMAGRTPLEALRAGEAAAAAREAEAIGVS